MATVGGDWVRFWDVATAKETRRVALPNKGPIDGFSTTGAQLAYSHDGKLVAVSSTRDGLIFLLEVASGRVLAHIDGPKNRLKALAFSPDGTILATGVDISPGRLPGRELAIRLWDVAAPRKLAVSRRIARPSPLWPSPPTAGGWSRPARTPRPWCGTWPGSSAAGRSPSNREARSYVAIDPGERLTLRLDARERSQG